MSPPLRILLLGRRAEELWNTVAEAFPCGAIRSATMSSDSTASAECVRSRPDLVILDATVPNERVFVDTLLSIVSKTRLLAITSDAEVRQDLRSRGVAAVSGEIDAAAFVDMLQFMLEVNDASRQRPREHVLVVDDEPLVRQMISNFLQRRGYSVSAAPHIQEATAMLDSMPQIGVVLLDVMLPDGGGVDMLARMAKQRVRPEVILMSGLADRTVAEHAVRLGAFDYLVKPIDLPSLESTVSACFGRVAYSSRSFWERVKSRVAGGKT